MSEKRLAADGAIRNAMRCARVVRSEHCAGCPYEGTSGCQDRVLNDAAEVIGAQAQRIRELEEQLERSRWIGVEERLPETGELVQTISDEGVREGCWLNVNGWWRLSIGISTQKVTHWRPVPKGLEGANE